MPAGCCSQHADYHGGGLGVFTGVRLAPGIEARVGYRHYRLDDPSLDEFNAAASWRSPEFGMLSAAVGGGYRRLKVDWDLYNHHDRLYGPFADLDLRARLLPAVALDVGYARLFLRNAAGSNKGSEVRLGIVMGAGPFDIIVRTRRMKLDDPASTFDKELRDTTLGFGIAWGYPPRHSPLMPPTPKQKRPHPPKK